MTATVAMLNAGASAYAALVAPYTAQTVASTVWDAMEAQAANAARQGAARGRVPTSPVAVFTGERQRATMAQIGRARKEVD